jgi:hypothetical protein
MKTIATITLSSSPISNHYNKVKLAHCSKTAFRSLKNWCSQKAPTKPC